MDQNKFVNYKDYKSYPIEEMQKRSEEFLEDIQRRRTIRDFSDKPVPEDIIINCLKAASTAPSGANRQPWHFLVVRDAELRKKLGDIFWKATQSNRAKGGHFETPFGLRNRIPVRISDNIG